MILSILIMPFLFFQRIIMNVGLDLIFFPILWRRLCQAMMAEDVKKTLDMAIEWTGVEHAIRERKKINKMIMNESLSNGIN